MWMCQYLNVDIDIPNCGYDYTQMWINMDVYQKSGYSQMWICLYPIVDKCGYDIPKWGYRYTQM